MKKVTRRLSNEFHEWQRRALPGCVIQDLDAWALVASDPRSFAPHALYELKRSFLPPDEWRPWPEDCRNYAALYELAQRAGIPLFGVYFQEGSPIEAETPFRVWSFSQVMPEYRMHAEVMSAETFAARFPFPLWPTA